MKESPPQRQLSFSFERPYEEPCEYKVVALRECPTPEDMQLCDTPEKAAAYSEQHIQTDRSFNPDRECCPVLMLNTRRRIRGHHIVSVGTLDSNLIHPREVFRAAIIANAAAILLLHPSGLAAPSQADIKVTRELIRGGRLLKIEVADHVIVGYKRHQSLRSLGYFYE